MRIFTNILSDHCGLAIQITNKETFYITKNTTNRELITVESTKMDTIGNTSCKTCQNYDVEIPHYINKMLERKTSSTEERAMTATELEKKILEIFLRKKVIMDSQAT